MTKDRLADFRAILLQNPSLDSDYDDVAMDDDFGWEAHDNAFMTDMLSEVEEIRAMMDHMDHNVSQVKLIYEDIISSPISSDRGRQKLSDLMTEIRTTANKVCSKLKIIEQKIDDDEKACAEGRLASYKLPGGGAHHRIRKTNHFTLTMTFAQIMTVYNQIQTEYREECKRRLRRQLEITGRSVTDDEFEEIILGQTTITVFTQGIVLEPHLHDHRQTLADIEARQADIIQLENSIRELHNLFINMTMITQYQGSMMDCIEKHVDTSRNNVALSRKHIVGAKKNGVNFNRRKQKRRILTAFFLLLAVGTIFVLGSVLVWQQQ